MRWAWVPTIMSLVMVWFPMAGHAAGGPAGASTTGSSTPPTGNAALGAAGTAGAAGAAGAAAAPTPTDPVTGIQAGQTAVIDQAHQGPITTAKSAVDNDELAKDNYDRALASDRAALAKDASTVDLDTQKLTSDQDGLAVAVTANVAAQARLQKDHTRLRDILVGLYTGSDSGPPPAGTAPLSLIQQQMYGQAEATVVVNEVVKDLHADVQTAAADGRRQAQLTTAVAGDTSALANDRQLAAAAGTRVSSDAANLGRAQASLAADQTHLTAAVAAQHAAVAVIVGPPAPGGGLSILGRSALSPTQLTAWFNATGYADLTSTPVSQLATWYVEDGTKEGVRGDIAFAQAVLETGGFDSSDAVTLNNYAGMGHCDTCAQGWALPSPEDGVLGQLQLLRIFAAGSAADGPGLPAPVLPALTPANEARQGCCQTWESLTGVWATDPAYASSILLLYQEILVSAESAAALTEGVPTA